MRLSRPKCEVAGWTTEQEMRVKIEVEGAELQWTPLMISAPSGTLTSLECSFLCWCLWFDYLVDVENLKQKLLSRLELLLISVIVHGQTVRFWSYCLLYQYLQ